MKFRILSIDGVRPVAPIARARERAAFFEVDADAASEAASRWCRGFFGLVGAGRDVRVSLEHADGNDSGPPYEFVVEIRASVTYTARPVGKLS